MFSLTLSFLTTTLAILTKNLPQLQNLSSLVLSSTGVILSIPFSVRILSRLSTIPTLLYLLVSTTSLPSPTVNSFMSEPILDQPRMLSRRFSDLTSSLKLWLLGEDSIVALPRISAQISGLTTPVCSCTPLVLELL